jgi:Tfp pilus assembly protein PilF
MTLVQVLANEMSLHMCTDFQLTNPLTRIAVHKEAHKLVRIPKGMVGVTGIAFLDGKSVGQWMAETTAELEPTATLEDVLLALQQAEVSLRKYGPEQDRRLTFIVGCFIGSQSIIALVSNFQQFDKGRVSTDQIARDRMTITKVRPKSEVLVVVGDSGSITADEQADLTLILRSGANDTTIQEKLRDLNVAVSARTTTVSAGCYTASLHATGLGSGRPFLTNEQQGDFIPPDSAHMLSRMGLQLNRGIGPDGKPLPIREVQSAVAMMGNSDEYFREQFKLRPDNAELWNNYGSFLVARRRYEDAIVAYERSVELDPSYPTATANLASNIWVHRGDIERARKLYSDVLAATEPSVPSWILSDFANFCEEALGDRARTHDLHARAAEDRNNPLAAARYASFKIRHGIDADLSRTELGALLTANPNDSRILDIAARADYFCFNDIDAARDKINKACSLDPTNAHIFRFAADISLRWGDAASAGYYYRKYLKREPHDVEAHSNYGLALLMERKTEGALRHLSKALRSSPDHLDIRTNLAATLWALRRDTDALAQVKVVMSSNPPPSIELEVAAMTFVGMSSSRAGTAVRMRELIEGGARADGNTVRSMRQDISGKERQTREQIALIIEGKRPIPTDW